MFIFCSHIAASIFENTDKSKEKGDNYHCLLYIKGGFYKFALLENRSLAEIFLSIMEGV